MVSVCFIPVHENYLRNKLEASRRSKGAARDTLQCLFTSSSRVALLGDLILRADRRGFSCAAIDFETDNEDLLSTSPEYWHRKLPTGYLKTVPTRKLVDAFTKKWVKRKLGPATRAVWTFGIDNLMHMPSWNGVERLFSNCDLALVSRPSESSNSETVCVDFRSDPSKLLKHFSTATLASDL